MKVRNKKTGKWVELPDGPTPEEEAEMERYKRVRALPYMAIYDLSSVEDRKRWAETGSLW